MSVIAADPDVHLLPSAVAHGIRTYLRHGIVDNFESVAHYRRIVTLGVRCLVDSGERDEGVSIARRGQPVGCLLSDAPVDLEPAAHITAEVRRCGASDERGASTNAVPAAKSAANHTQGAEARLRQLENCRRCRIDVAIHEAHLRTDVAPRMPGEPRDTSRPIVPAKSGQSNAAGISSHQEWSVRRTGH